MSVEEIQNEFVKQWPENFVEPSYQYGWPTGWHQIVTELAKKVIETDPEITIFQVKEKFGGLRFYVGKTSQEVLQMISEAECQSEETCQRCGKPGSETHDRGWITTLCDECKG